MIRPVYITKKDESPINPWVKFGAPNKEVYEKWSPQVCGICCLKMIGDTYGYTNKISVYQLTMECKRKGGFNELPNGEIQGVYHEPLLELSKNYGLTGNVERNLNIEKILFSLAKNRFIILSIDKSKINPSLKGGHLILLHAYNRETKVFAVNDPDPILSKKGKNIKIGIDKLQRISNKRGLILWPKHQTRR